MFRGPTVRRLGAAFVAASMALGGLGAPPARAADETERGAFLVEPVDPVPDALPSGRDARPLARRGTDWYGPIELREGWLLAQPLMSLPATSADVLAPGCVRARVLFQRGSDFGWRQDVKGETPAVRDFLVDGEHQTIALEWRQGIGRGIDVGVRVPVQWRGAGFMDDAIDAFHEATGLLDNIREAFDTNRFRVEGMTKDSDLFSWNGDSGSGLGRIEVEARASLGCTFGGRTAIVVRAGLPTGSGPFGRRGDVDLGAQLVHSRRLGRRVAMHGGVGVVHHGDRTLDGVRYVAWRPHAFAVLEFVVTPRLTALVQASAVGNLADNIRGYPETNVYLDGGLAWRLNDRWTLELLINENVVDQQSTTDFGVLLALAARF